jgi:hypothetical protein
MKQFFNFFFQLRDIFLDGIPDRINVDALSVMSMFALGQSDTVAYPNVKYGLKQICIKPVSSTKIHYAFLSIS